MSHNPMNYDAPALYVQAEGAPDAYLQVHPCEVCGALIFDCDLHDRVDCGAPLGDGK